jgi:hypothetical protein
MTAHSRDEKQYLNYKYLFIDHQDQHPEAGVAKTFYHRIWVSRNNQLYSLITSYRKPGKLTHS